MRTSEPRDAPEIEASFVRGELIAAYIHLPRMDDVQSTRCECVEPGLVVDFAAGGEPIGIEVSMPRLVTLEAINVVLRRLGLSELDERDFAPLKAA